MKRLIIAFMIILLLLTSCSTLDSLEIEGESDKTEYSYAEGYTTYIVNTATLSYHKSSCYMAKRVSEENRWEAYDEEFLQERGYKRCGVCFKQTVPDEN